MRHALALFCLLLLLGGVGTAQPIQTLNMSLDLVRLGIAARNLTPDDPTLDARPLIQAALNYVRANHVPRLTINRGSYYILTAENSAFHLFVEDLTDLTIDLAGSDLFFRNGRLGGFQCRYCQRLTLTNFTMDYLEAPSTQARVTSVDAVRRVINYTTLPGYRSPTVFADRAQTSELSPVVALAFRGGQIVPGTTRMPLQAVTASGVELFQNGAPWTQGPTLATLLPGDTLVVTFRLGFPQLACWTCTTTTYSHIRLYSAGNWAVHMAQATNSVVEYLRLEPRAGGLIGTTSDGIHFTHPIGANHIRHCYVTRTVDDALIMDSGPVGIVQSQPTSRQVVVGGRDSMMNTRFPNGTSMRFLDFTTGGDVTAATIVAQDPPDSRVNAYAPQVTLTFDRDLPALAPGTRLTFNDAPMRGLGSTVEDNIVEDVPFGRGIWIAASSGVTVRRNVIRTTSLGAVTISQHTETFSDTSSSAANITVDSNVMEGVLGPAASGTGTFTSMASIIAITTTFGRFSASPVNTNLAVVRNYIADSGRAGVFMNATGDSTVTGNFITRWHQRPHLPMWGIHPDDQSEVYGYWRQPIVSRDSSGLTVADNDIQPQSSITAPVRFSSPVTVLSAAAGSAVVDVTPVVAGFQWKATTTDPWITLTPPVVVEGPGSIAYSVNANTASTPRTGSIVVAGQTVSITQPGASVLATPGLLALAPPSIMGSLVTLAWSEPVGGQPPTGYTVIASLTPGGPPVAMLPVGLVRTVSVAAPSGAFYVRIAASNANGQGPLSNEVAVVVGSGVVPGPPVNVAARVNGGALVIAWRAPDNVAIAPVQTYVIEAGTAPGLSNLANFATGSTATEFVAPQIAAGSYYIRLRARNGAGTGAASSEIRVDVGASPPGPPTLSGHVGTGRSVSLNWTPPTFGASPTGYLLQAGTAPGLANVAAVNLPLNPQSFSTSGVPPGTYYVRVSATSVAALGAASNEVVLVVP